MLANYVLETVNAPGTTATVNLAGAPTGFRSWAQGFSSGATCYYIMYDGTQIEWGYGTFMAGSPNTFNRATVLGNSAGTTSRLNFTASGVYIYCDLPAERAVYKDQSGNVQLPGSFGVAGNMIVTVNNNYLYGVDTGGTNKQMIGVDNTNYLLLWSGGAGIRIVNSGNTVELFKMLDDGRATFWSDVWVGRAAGTNLIGTTASGVHLAANGSAEIYSASATPLNLGVGGAGAVVSFFYGSSGVASITTNGSVVSYNTTSDYRLKNTYGPADGSALLNVPVYDAEWKNNPNLGRYPMVLAHELQAHAPEAVYGDKDAVDAQGDPVMQQVDHSAIVPRLLALVQSMHADITSLQAQVAALQANH